MTQAFPIAKQVRRGRVDKSALPYGEPERVRDRRWLDTARDRPCEVCGSTGTTVGAHVRCTTYAGAGQKPDDRHVLWLCFDHHRQFDGLGTEDKALWLVRNVVLPLCESRYSNWKARNG